MHLAVEWEHPALGLIHRQARRRPSRCSARDHHAILKALAFHLAGGAFGPGPRVAEDVDGLVLRKAVRLGENLGVQVVYGNQMHTGEMDFFVLGGGADIEKRAGGAGLAECIQLGWCDGFHG